MARALLDAACGPIVEDEGSLMVGYGDPFVICMILISFTILSTIIFVCGRKEPMEKKNDNTGGVSDGGGGTYTFVSGGGRLVIDIVDVGGGQGRTKVEGLSGLQSGVTLGEPTKRKYDDTCEPTKKKNDDTGEPTNKKNDNKGGNGGNIGGTYSFVSGGVFNTVDVGGGRFLTNTVDVGGGRVRTNTVNIGGGRVFTNTVDVGGGRVRTNTVNIGGGRVLTNTVDVGGGVHVFNTVIAGGGSSAAYTSASTTGGAVGGVSC